MFATIVRFRLMSASRALGRSNGTRMIVNALAVIALIAGALGLWLLSTLVFEAMVRVTPGIDVGAVYSLLCVVGAVLVFVAAVGSAYQVLFRRDRHEFLSTAPVPEWTLMAVESLEVWLRAGGIVFIVLSALGAGIGAATGGLLAVGSCAALGALVLTATAAAAGTVLLIWLVSVLGRQRVEELLASATTVLFAAYVLLSARSVRGVNPDVSGGPMPPDEAARVVNHVTAAFRPSWSPATWAGDAVRAAMEGDPAGAVLRVTAAWAVCFAVAAVLVLAARRVHASTARDVAVARRPGSTRLSRAAESRIRAGSPTGSVALQSFRLTWRDNQQRTRLVLLPVLLSVYAIALPGMFVDRSVVDALVTAVSPGLAAGAVLAFVAFSRLSLEAAAGEGPVSWLVSSSPLSGTEYVRGRVIGVWAGYCAVAVPAVMLGALAASASAVALLRDLVTVPVLGAALMVLGAALGAGSRGSRAGVTGPPVLTALLFIVLGLAVAIAASLAAVAGLGAWLISLVALAVLAVLCMRWAVTSWRLAR